MRLLTYSNELDIEGFIALGYMRKTEAAEIRVCAQAVFGHI